MPSFGTAKNITLDELELFLDIPSWETRTLPFITLISPNFNAFTPEWIGDDRTTEKKVAIYDYPGRDDTATLDLGKSGTSYPLRIFFHGPGSDVASRDFQDALNERGKWEIIHPTVGYIRAQPISFTVRDNPTQSGGVYEVQTEFIEAIDVEELTLGSGLNLLAAVFEVLAIAASISALAVSVALMVQSAFREIQALRSTFQKSTASIQERLSSLAQTSSEVLAAFNSKVNEIETLLDNTVIDISQIGSAIHQLIAIPANTTTDFNTRFQTYKTMTNDILGLSPTGTSPEDRNTVLTQELVLSGIVITNAIVATSSDYRTRREAIDAANGLRAQFDLISTGLDNVQKNFGDQFIAEQYFSNSTSYPELADITSKAIDFVRATAFNLDVEKRVTIESPTAVMKFIISEYGFNIDLDQTLNDFVDFNKLEGDEILLLPPGREVVVYGQ